MVSSRIQWRCLAAVLLCFSCIPIAADELGAADLIARVQAWLDGTERLEGRFEQSIVSGAMGEGMSENGRLWVERPGRMRWDYLEPDLKVALVDGETTRLYVEEEREMYLGQLDGESGLLPRLLAGSERFTDRFKTQVLATPSGGGNGFYLIQLMPHTESESFEELILLTRPPQFAIEGAEIVDPAGNTIRYRFSDLRRNQPLPAGWFAFEPPPGTIIEGQR